MNFLDFFIVNKGEILDQTIEHIGLALTSLTISILIGVPLGIVATRLKKIKDFVIGFVGVIQTIPSLALLGFLIPLFGIGAVPAIIALFLYALLPIVRNTCTGIEEVDSKIKEAAKGMGMSESQILTKVELPLAVPVIFSGVRTAAVLNVGIATLCAYIAAGGLGEYIFRGIALNNTNMILAGAIPAALLAILFDFSLGMIQRYINHIIRPSTIVIVLSIFLIFIFSFLAFTFPSFSNNEIALSPKLILGIVPEFKEREDGYRAIVKTYDLKLKTKELDNQLMFQALKDKKVDIISANSTEGRIKTFKLKVLEDDKKAFPSYFACPLVSGKTLKKYPELRSIFLKIAGKINNEKMAELNYKAEFKKKLPKEVAKEFLNELGLSTEVERTGKPDLIIGSKNFTEQFILTEIFSILIENHSKLNVETKKGLAGTKLCFEALKKGEINSYPEYTGTGLFVLLKRSKINGSILGDSDRLYAYVKDKSKKLFDIEWLEPLGFNNTWTLVMREEDASKLMISRISDLKNYLDVN